MLQKMAFVAVVTSAFWMNAALALGLGDIDVKSKLNQKFSGSIPLTSLGPDEADGLLINLASNEDFARAGIERSEYVSTLRFSFDSAAQNPRILVTSAQLAREPFISFMVDVRGKSGRILREYTILLDPQEITPKVESLPAPPPPAKPVASKPAPVPAGAANPPKFYETAEEASKPKLPVPAAKPEPAIAAPVAASTVVTTPSAVSGQYGPVAPRETLWSVATKLRADPSITMDQVLLSIYMANPSAFAGGISGLQKGVTLQVPTLQAQKAVSPELAKTKVAQLRGQAVSAPVETTNLVAKPKPVQVVPDDPVKVVPPVDTPAAPQPAKPAKPAVAPAASPVDPAKKPVTSSTAPTAAAKPETVVPVPASPKVPDAAVSKSVEAAPISAAPEPAAVAATPAPASEAAAVTPPIPVDTVPAPVEEAPAPRSLPPIPTQSTTESSLDTGEMDAQLPLLGILVMALLAAIGGLLVYRKKKGGAAAGGKKIVPQPSTVAPNVAEAAATPAVNVAPKVQATTVSNSQRVKNELEKLSDTLNQETAVAASTAAATTTLDSTLSMTAPVPPSASSTIDFNATQAVEPAAASMSRVADRVDFDVTSQFAAETMSINLDAGDPISEAEFHLAYGLYDEAALLLSQAAQQEPARTDLRVKLAEVYFAASKSVEFQETAEGLKAQLPAAEWQKLAIMGQQLCPDSTLFHGSAGDDLADAVDLSFDEPAAPPADATQVAMPDIQASGGNAMEFKLDDIATPDVPSEPAPAATDSGALDFKLEIPDIQVQSLSLDQPPSTDAASNLIDIDSQHFDLTSAFESAEKSSPSPAVDARNRIDLDIGGEIKLDDFDLGSDSTLSSGDEAGTKLDLARAYLDMGDNEMARGLLNEVKQQGSDQQKSEADLLIARLGS